MPDREEIVDDLFARARDTASSDREVLLAAEASHLGDDIVAEVRALLADHAEAEAGGFLGQPLVSSPFGSARLGPGASFEGYQIVSLVGEGGMGEVYRARDGRLNRDVAIKLIRGHAGTGDFQRRFQNEQILLAGLQHPNIAQLFEARSTAGGASFFVMEFIDGRPIDAYVAERKLSIAERLTLFLKLCSAVSHAHQKLTVHRDIKPSNVLVTSAGEPKLLDFGIAKLLQDGDQAPVDVTGTAFRVMTPEYASPEQVRGEPLTTATDVYSLGVLLYKLLTGRGPYTLTHRTFDEVTQAVREQEPTRPSAVASDKALRGDLDTIVLRALAKEPARRYASVEQLSEDIRRHLEGLPVLAQPDTLKYRASKFVGRHRVAVAAAAIVVLALVGGLAATLWQARVARRERAIAERRFNDVRALAHSVLFDYHDAIAALPGATKVRKRLVQDGLSYLDSLSKEAGDDPVLMRELADAYAKVAGLQGFSTVNVQGVSLSQAGLGDIQGALASQAKATALRERVAAADRRDTRARVDLAFAYSGMAAMEWELGHPDRTFPWSDKALAILEPIRGQNRADRQVNHLLFVEYLGRAKFLGSPSTANVGDTKGALAFLAKAEDLVHEFEQDEATEPAVQVQLGQFYNFKGSLLGAEAKPQEALEARLKAVAIDEKLVAANPLNTMYRSELAIQEGNVGTSFRDMNNNDEAFRHFTKALDLYDGLMAADPNDAMVHRNGAVGHRNLAVSLGAEHRDDAVKHFKRSIELLSGLVAKSPTNGDVVRQLAFSYMAFSRFQTRVDDFDGAVASAAKGIRLADGLVKTASTNVAAWRTLALLYSTQGFGYEGAAQKTSDAARWRAARAAFQRSADIFGDMEKKGTLTKADANWPDDMKAEVAKCDAALAATR